MAIQDIATGNVDADIFALYQLQLIRDALYADPAVATELADMIVDQAEAQAPDFSWGSAADAPGIVNAIAGSIGSKTAAEADLATALLRRVEGHLAR